MKAGIEYLEIAVLAKFILKITSQIFRTGANSTNFNALQAVLLHSTPRRIFNLLLVEMEYRLRLTRLWGRPYVIIIDPLNFCNLQCPLCSTGLLQKGRKPQMMSWGTYTHTLDMLSPYAYKINLFHWGEPLLHPDIIAMIKYARSKNLGTSMSTNLSMNLSDELINQLIESGLELLTLSIDGATQDVYSKYRRLGNLDLVKKNARRLIERRNQLDSRTPLIQWQFIPMKHNEHETKEAERLSSEIGCDQFRLIPMGIPFDSQNPQQMKKDWLPINTNDGPFNWFGPMPFGCFYLYRYIVINPDGKTSPCSAVSGEHNDFGDIVGPDLIDLWNNDKYRSGRSLFNQITEQNVSTVCNKCALFTKV